MSLENRYDFVMLFDVENGNPNGAVTKYFMIDSTAENTQTKYNIYTEDYSDLLPQE